MFQTIKKLFIKHVPCDCEDGKTAYWTPSRWFKGQGYFLCQNCGQVQWE